MEQLSDSHRAGANCNCELSIAQINLPPSDPSQLNCCCGFLWQFVCTSKACRAHRSPKLDSDRHQFSSEPAFSSCHSSIKSQSLRGYRSMQTGSFCLLGSRLLAVAFVCLALFATPFFANSASCLPSKPLDDISINYYEAEENNIPKNSPHTDNVNNGDHQTWKSGLGEEPWDVNHVDRVNNEDAWPQESPTVTEDPHLDNVCHTDICIENSRYLLNSLDLDVNPCDDFYRFACGSYLRDHPVPLHVKSWSHFVKVFYEIRDNIKEKLNKNQADFQKVTHNQTVFKKLYDFYHGCLNKEQRTKTGYTYLFSLINDIGGWPMINRHWNDTTFYWEKTYVRLTKLDMYFFLRIEAMTDLTNTSKTIIKIGPPYKFKENIVETNHIKIPSYTNKFAYKFMGRRTESAPTATTPTEAPQKKLDAAQVKRYEEIIKELKDHSEFAHDNLESDNEYWNEQLEKIYVLQTELENSAQPILPMENYLLNYDSYLYNISQIKQWLGLDLAFIIKEMFGQQVAANTDQKFFVPDIKYLKRAGEILKATDKRVLSNYLITNMVMTIARHTTPKMISLLVTDPLDDDVMQNICYEETSLYLPELLGKFFLDNVAKLSSNLQEEEKEVNLVMELLRESFSELLRQSKWMDNSTIEMAIKKLKRMTMHIGAPKWYFNDTDFEPYSAMFNKIDADNYFRSVVDVTEVGQLLEMRELSERLHATSSATLINWPGRRKIIDVNAFYYFTTNGVYVPAAILQPPFFYQKGVPKAVTFGSMGMILGHEMSHAFDNSGRLYNYEGALQKWWTNATLESFQNKTDCFVRQYSNYKEESIAIDGLQTLSENIADNGGVRKAYRAFKIYQQQNKTDGLQRMPARLSKFNPDQLFFISFATMWCARLDPSEINGQNSHSPPSIRVLGSLANNEEFSKAFNCPKNSRMNPPNKCILW